ncbi:M20 family metallopeptidase [Bordetella genomosp. 11]|uniref:Amidohydrolase n=1 Tax=Bordetella genomosp. 11 TaxID=1416808 RepID=A0A261UFS3_9BORD|nr:M20 family metallopeptidase [Bordetella genomosp. 11]OZI60786.1 amidohydrolase [Bordetella genomosp. 11]
MTSLDQLLPFFDEHTGAFAALSDSVWETPEIAYTEFRSVAAHTETLRRYGFRVTEDMGGIPTAVMGEAGEGGPVIAILGEYDALPGLSQVAGATEHKEVHANGHGHGCGHNLLGSASLMAAAAVKAWLAKTGKPGRVRYYGCPAEEGGAAKAFMVRAGCFKDVDIAISWHPAAMTRVDEAQSLANTRMDFHFTGRASHAAAAPHLGRSALDAVELMNVGVNYMREHMPSDARIHYAMLDSGGIAPNVVQASAKVRYAIRARDLPGMLALNERVKKVAQGAALMTETHVEYSIMSALSNMLPNKPLEAAMYQVMQRLGPVPFDAQDMAFAASIQATLSEEDISAAYRRAGVEPRATPLCDFIVPIEAKGELMIGSTDVGDVSWVVPTIQARVATQAIGTPGHSWQVVAQGKSPAAHKGMVHAARIMAGTALEVLTDETLMARAKKDHQERTQRMPYVCPIPDSVSPPIQPRPSKAA